jgi:hypothetical protein
MTSRPSPGIYDRLLDQDLRDLLARYPELRPLFGKLEAEEQPSRYAEFVSQVLKQALLEEPDPAACQCLAFPAEFRVFHGLHRVGQHVPCCHDQRAGMEP